MLGLLMAPQPGHETQRQVREALREIMDAGKEAAHEEERRLLARYRELISRG
jgi:Spy/CpxP family protein refolding chaperone